jgi:hypothetical protein
MSDIRACRLRFGPFFRLWRSRVHFCSPVTCGTLGTGAAWSDWKMRFRSTSRVLGIVRYVTLSGQPTIGYSRKAGTLEGSEHPLNCPR